jgi:hypothetical protein
MGNNTSATAQTRQLDGGNNVGRYQYGNNPIVTGDTASLMTMLA